MVLILDGNSEMDANGRSHLCYLICLRPLIRSIAVQIRFVFLQNTYSKLPSNVYHDTLQLQAVSYQKVILGFVVLDKNKEKNVTPVTLFNRGNV